MGVILCGQTAASSAQKRADTEFLRTLALDHPWVTRILLSEDGDTLSNLNAVNDAHVFKILFKPWDRARVQSTVTEAMGLHELQTRHQHLASELQNANEVLIAHIDDKNRALRANARSLMTTQRILDTLPVGVLHIGEDGRILEANNCARDWISQGHAISGMKARKLLPEGLLDLPLGEGVHCVVGETRCLVLRNDLNGGYPVPSQVITLLPQGGF